MGVLRFLLAISVILAHTGPLFGFLTMVGGYMAVKIFFIISGFYMGLILNEKYTEKHHYKLFITNRFLRIYPAYWFIFILTLVLSLLSYVVFSNFGKLHMYQEYIDLIFPGPLLFFIISHIIIFGQDIIMFLGLDQNGSFYFAEDFTTSNPIVARFLLVPQAWSLGVELMFYLVAPFIVRKVHYILIVMFISLLLKLFIYFGLGYQKDPWTYRFFPTELFTFLLGSLAYKIYAHKTGFAFVEKYKGKKIWFLILPIFLLITYPYLSRLDFIDSSFLNWTYFVIFAAMLPFLFHFSKKSKLDNFIGEFSYPMYVSHMLIVYVVTVLGGYFSFMRENDVELSIVLTMLFSYFMIKLLIDPIERLRQARIRKMEQ